MMTTYPAPHVAFAQEVVPEVDPVVEVDPGEPGEEGQPGEEGSVEEPVYEDLDLPESTPGDDGEDSEDAEDGTDGSSPNDGSGDPEPGDDGESTEDTEQIEEQDSSEEEEEELGNTSIVTGDAESTGGLENNVDLSILNQEDEEPCDNCPIVMEYIYFDKETGTYKTSNPGSQWKLDIALEDGLLDPMEYLEIVTPERDTMASTTNVAVVENEVEVEAETGENSASGNDNVTIQTGDATAVSNVLNVVNTNIFDSEGFFLFLDNLTDDGVQGDLDFREFDFFNPQAVQETSNSREGASNNPITAICPTCGGEGDLTINAGQTAGITNDIVVRSGTGANTALQNAGDVSIGTGDAYAAANTINLANTNIVDSNYLLLTFNNYGDYNDNIVFPSAGEFLEMFETGGQSTPAQVNVDNTNTTGVDNNADVGAETGTNTANGTTNGGSIATGDAHSSNNTLNQINSNLFGGSSFSILVKVHGEWDGDVIGIPDDMEWYETPNGIELVYDSEAQGPATGYDAINVTTDNSAQINNNISVMALTGENQIEGAGGDASITTGDAYAAANTINVANTNVIGKNWMMAVINIFGDWTGDITFGESNLWIGAKANISTNNPGVGTPFNYEYTVMNTGDAPATNVCLRNRFDHRYIALDVLNPTTDREISSGEVEYCIGTVEPGEVREFSRGAHIRGEIPYGSTYLTNEIEVHGSGEESFLEDNTEVVTFDVWRENITYNTGKKIVYKPSPVLSVTKVNASPFYVRASSTVDYRVIVRNDGAGSSYDSVLIDTLYNEEGEKVYEEYWNLGEIYPGEEIEVLYTTYFNAATEAGLYTNVARVEALGGYHTWTYGHDASSEPAESTIKIVPYVQPIVVPEVIEVIEESVEVNEIEPGEEPSDEVEEVLVETEEDEPVVLAIAVPEPTSDFVPVFGPFHGPFYYESGSNQKASAVESLFAGKKFDHPVFGNHPVYKEFIIGENHDHPKFGNHPVYSKHTYLDGGAKQARDNALREFVAGIGFIKLLNLPFDPVAVDTSDEDEDDENEKILALLALSMFVLRKPRRKGLNESI